MELNWTTFLLEIINFLVLVWLLKHFLYKPVYRAIEKRRQAIEDDLSSAREKNQQAEELLQQQQEKLTQWQHHQQQAKQALQLEIEKEREKKLAALDATLEAERKRRSAIDQHQQQQQQQALERQALTISGRFAGQLLGRFSGPELQRLIIDATIDDLCQPTEKQKETLAQALANKPLIQISSACPIDDAHRQRLLAVLQSFSASSDFEIDYTLDPELICGISIAVECFQIQANIAHELRFFSEANHGESCE